MLGPFLVLRRETTLQTHHGRPESSGGRGRVAGLRRASRGPGREQGWRPRAETQPAAQVAETGRGQERKRNILFSWILEAKVQPVLIPDSLDLQA